MIQEKLLDNQVGIQYKGPNDLTETAQVDLMNHGVLIGKFKRGMKSKPFTVKAQTYKKLLGYDPNNPDYKAVEEFFASGGTHLTIIRMGSPQQRITTRVVEVIAPTANTGTSTSGATANTGTTAKPAHGSSYIRFTP